MRRLGERKDLVTLLIPFGDLCFYFEMQMELLQVHPLAKKQLKKLVLPEQAVLLIEEMFAQLVPFHWQEAPSWEQPLWVN